MLLKKRDVNVPSVPAGQYYLQFSIGIPAWYDTGSVDFQASNNQQLIPITVRTPPSPDLEPVSCTHEMNNVSAVRIMSVSCSVKNAGNSMTVTTTWSDRLSLMRDSGEEAIGCDKFVTRFLASGENYVQLVSLEVPPILFGDFRIQFHVNYRGDIAEYGGEKIIF
jgi:hypothetical protein